MKTLTILKSNRNYVPTRKKDQEIKSDDIIITRTEKVEEYDPKEDKTTITNKKTKINLTRKINATSQLVKEANAQEKLEAIKKAII